MKYTVVIEVSDPLLTQAERRGLFWALSDSLNAWLVQNEMDEIVTGTVREVSDANQS